MNDLQAWPDMEEIQMHLTERKKPVWKGHTPYGFSCTTFWKRQNHGDSESGGSREGWEGAWAAHRDI